MGGWGGAFYKLLMLLDALRGVPRPLYGSPFFCPMDILKDIPSSSVPKRWLQSAGKEINEGSIPWPAAGRSGSVVEATIC